jgi:hypothetical protein
MPRVQVEAQPSENRLIAVAKVRSRQELLGLR